MTRILGLEFAPLLVPLERRLQTLTVFSYTLMFSFWPIFCYLLFIVLIFTRYYWVTLLYAAWIFYDVVVRESSARGGGGRRWEWLRRHPAWRHMRNYFPMELIKTGELDPDRNYIMGYHPHGIMGCGAIGNFASDGGGFSRLFPGITVHVLTLAGNFKIPLMRAFLLWMGVCDVSKDSIRWIVTRQGAGNAAVVVVGGAEEALEARPGNYNLKLKNRKGFVYLAVKAGADLVPIYSFGENDLFLQVDNPEGSRLRNFQKKFKKFFGFSPPIFHGRGIFNYTYGFLPFRKPIHSVVGKPVRVEKCDKPESELIDSYHQKYLDALSQVFDEYKEKFGIDKDVHLNFI